MPSNDKIVKFCDFLTGTYMQEIFSPILRAFKSDIITNNVYEYFYSKFNALLL
jgi:hypothetical protein